MDTAMFKLSPFCLEHTRRLVRSTLQMFCVLSRPWSLSRKLFSLVFLLLSYILWHTTLFSHGVAALCFEEISEFYLLSLNSSHLLLNLGNLSFNTDCPMLFSYASMPSICFLVFALCCPYALLIYGVLQSYHLFCYL